MRNYRKIGATNVSYGSSLATGKTQAIQCSLNLPQLKLGLPKFDRDFSLNPTMPNINLSYEINIY